MSPFWFSKKSDRKGNSDPPADKPGRSSEISTIIEMPKRLAEARKLSDQRSYRESNGILEPLLAELEHAEGPAVDDIRAKLLGLVGTNYFHLGDNDQSRAFTRKALEECHRVNDGSGVRTYRTNLRFLNNQPVSKDPRMMELEIKLLKKLDRCQRLGDQSRWKESNELLENILRDKELELPVLIDRYRGKIHGLMAENHLMLDDRAAARHFAEVAIEDCRRCGDEDGVTVYTNNLNSIA